MRRAYKGYMFQEYLVLELGQRLESIQMEDGRIPLLREVKCNLSVPSSYPIKYQSQDFKRDSEF